MKLELNEITNSPEHGDHFEIKKDGRVIRSIFYRESYRKPREEALEIAKGIYEQAKTEVNKTTILSEEI